VSEAVSLRERKKAKTRALIQREALHLFSRQGYDATTVEQIAAAAEVSESTFFRYFPSKEEVVLWDQFDSRVVDAFKAQPAELHPVDALQQAFHSALVTLSGEEMVELQQRSQLIATVPSLRAALLDQMANAMRLIGDAVAERAHPRGGAFAGRVLAGAIVGTAMAVMSATAEDSGASLSQLLEDAVAELRRWFSE
jgi:AcrR family transcriptional regulator